MTIRQETGSLGVVLGITKIDESSQYPCAFRLHTNTPSAVNRILIGAVGCTYYRLVTIDTCHYLPRHNLNPSICKELLKLYLNFLPLALAL